MQSNKWKFISELITFLLDLCDLNGEENYEWNFKTQDYWSSVCMQSYGKNMFIYDNGSKSHLVRLTNVI